MQLCLKLDQSEITRPLAVSEELSDDLHEVNLKSIEQN
jgi:hypothetical protein|tara:strand:+ start:387 stop:500 length:114 start_codon:yes stop_codon:yes gene_type:complete